MAANRTVHAFRPDVVHAHWWLPGGWIANGARADEHELAALGVWNVPAFLSHGEVFIGRQHLPMIEWLATGRA